MTFWTFAFSHLLIKAETLLSLGSKGHFPFPESTLPGSRRKIYSWNSRRFRDVIRKCHFFSPPRLWESGGWSLNPLRGRHFECIKTDNGIISVKRSQWLAEKKGLEKLPQRYRICWEERKSKTKQHTKAGYLCDGEAEGKTLRAIQKPVRRLSAVSEHQLIIPQCKRTSWTSVSTLGSAPTWTFLFVRHSQSSSACVRQKYAS